MASKNLVILKALMPINTHDQTWCRKRTRTPDPFITKQEFAKSAEFTPRRSSALTLPSQWLSHRAEPGPKADSAQNERPSTTPIRVPRWEILQERRDRNTDVEISYGTLNVLDLREIRADGSRAKISFSDGDHCYIQLERSAPLCH